MRINTTETRAGTDAAASTAANATATPRSPDHARAGAGESAPQRLDWRHALLVYGKPRMLSMLFLGFSSGLPFYLIFQTLSAWLRQDHIMRSTIGMLSWAGLFYSLKFLWAPAMDRWRLPLLHRWLGRRRSWMLLAQFGIAAALLSMSTSEPSAGLRHVIVSAIVLGFFAASQDIAMDAWRIESAPEQEQGAMAAAYSVGYRLALIVGSAGALGLAQGMGWAASYRIMAALVSVGVVTTLLVREPAPAARAAGRRVEAHPTVGLLDALMEFFTRHGVGTAVLILLLIGSYHFTDYAMGSMVNPFYIDHGYTLGQIATVVKIVGLSVNLVGGLLAGLLIARIGLRAALLLGSLLIMSSNLGFALLAHTAGPTMLGLALANVLDNLALAMQGMALIAYLSSLTNPKYTATQYALFSSFYALTGKTLEGTSGFVVQAIGYVHFFVYTAALSIPPLLLLYWLSRRPGHGAANGSGGTWASA